MAVQFPAGHRRLFPDVERVIVDALAEPAAALTPKAEVCAWIDSERMGKIKSGHPVIRVMRMPGGGTNDSGIQDTAIVQIAVFASTRSDSWDVLDYVTRHLLALDENGTVRHEDGTVTDVLSVKRDASPIQVPDQALDPRLVWDHFRVTCRKLRG